MLVSQRLAIAAHLHVLLRRKTGRVTDTEWMAGNMEYAMEIVRFARARAAEDKHPELAEWADKLEAAMLASASASPARPLVQMLKQRHTQAAPSLPQAGAESAPPSEFGAQSTFGNSSFAESTSDAAGKPADTAAAPRYVGGIR